jgi:hypothetical protein
LPGFFSSPPAQEHETIGVLAVLVAARVAVPAVRKNREIFSRAKMNAAAM